MSTNRQDSSPVMNKFVRILLFVCTAILLVFLFPQQQKFKYEYLKGKPWKHKDLVAPLDYPINKDAYSLALEKDSFLNNFSPYFIYNPSIILSKKEKLAGY